MTLKKLIVTILALFSFSLIFGQNGDSVRIVTFERTHQNLNYQKLLAKYANPGQPVDSVEFEYLYYLKYKLPGFSYYNLNSEEMVFRDTYDSRDYQKCAGLGIKLLKKDPTDLTTLIYTATSFKNLHKPDSAQLLLRRFDLLISIITKYGDGKTPDSAFRVVKISDEYAILKHKKEMFYNRKTLQEPDCIIDSWDIFNAKTGKNYNLSFKFNNLYIHADE